MHNERSLCHHIHQIRGWVAYGQRASYIPDMLPDLMQVETTSLCNLRCVFCPYPMMTRSRQFMHFAHFESFLEKQCGHLKSIGLHHFGEPFLDANLPKYIKKCSDLGIQTTISTNATKVNPDNALSVVEAGVSRIIISLDATTSQTYRKLRVKGDFSAAIEGAKSLLQAKLQTGALTYIQVQFIVTPENEMEADEFKEYWNGKAGLDQVVIRDERTHGGQIERHDAYIKRKTERQPCRYLWESLVILANGDVTICCKDFDGKAVLGNIFTGGTLEEIWNGDELQKLRTKHILNDLTGTMCEGCDEWCGHRKMNELESIHSYAEFRLQKKQNRKTQTHKKNYDGE